MFGRTLHAIEQTHGQHFGRFVAKNFDDIFGRGGVHHRKNGRDMGKAGAKMRVCFTTMVVTVSTGMAVDFAFHFSGF